MKYLLASILGLVILQYQFEILFFDSILWHIFNYAPFYIIALIILIVYQLAVSRFNSINTETIQTELSQVISKASLIQTNKIFTMIVETDFNNDESYRKLRDELLIITAERNLLYSLVSSNRNNNAIFESVKVKIINYLKSYKIDLKEVEK